MTIVQRMRAGLTESMKARDAVRTQFLRYWIAGLTLGNGQEMPDADAVKKMRGVLKEAKGGTTTFSPEEIALLQEWIPASLSREQILEALAPVADQIKAAPKDGMAMGVAMKALAGQPADADDVKAVIAQIRSLPGVRILVTDVASVRSSTWKYEEEGHARDLHDALSAEFAGSDPETRVSVSGGGVHWNCTATRGERSCSVACFDDQGPEYLVSFERHARTDATGRTRSRGETVAAVADWLDGREVGDLHRRFAFVDYQERSLAAIEAEALESCPELGRLASSEVRHIISDLFELWFKARDRSCRVHYYGKNRLPIADFHWDECALLRIQTGDSAHLAAMLERWLCEHAMPSVMAADFPQLEVNGVARYYEEGRPVEGEFIASWDAIEAFYGNDQSPLKGPILDLIAGIRRAGYDKTLRAGTSLWSLIVSRSRRHGLRGGQPSIAFQFGRMGMEVDSNVEGHETVSFARIEFWPQIDALLSRLTTKEID